MGLAAAAPGQGGPPNGVEATHGLLGRSTIGRADPCGRALLPARRGYAAVMAPDDEGSSARRDRGRGAQERAGAALDRILAELEIEPAFPDEVTREVERLCADPGLDDPSLEDLTAVPFVTIDGASSRALDQAIHVAREPGGFLIRYALADAAHFVVPGTALFAEAVRRGSSYYLPGRSVPMLPRALSEDLVSLNPGVDRRALTFEIRLSDRGVVLGTRIARSRVHSRRKLSFGDVQRFYDAPRESALAREPFASSLELLRASGEVLLREALARDVARFRRREIEVRAGGEEDAGSPTFVVSEDPRLPVEIDNEQVSLLTNREGGRLLRESPAPHLQPIYRVHAAPAPERISALAELTRGVAEVHGLGVDGLVYREAEPLARFLDHLPTEPGLDRIVRAVERQVMLVNTRSSFAIDPSEHFGAGADVYARFSSPMREVVGVFVHKELIELLDPSASSDAPIDERVRAEVVDAANRAKGVQRAIDERVLRVVLDDLFGADLRFAEAERPRRRGTIVGITSSKVHVALDAPALDVKVYVRDLGRQHGGAWLALANGGAALRDDRTGRVVCRLGDAVTVRTLFHDERQDRWALALERP